MISPILEARAEILTIISLLFLENLRHHNFVLRLSDLHRIYVFMCFHIIIKFVKCFLHKFLHALNSKKYIKNELSHLNILFSFYSWEKIQYTWYNFTWVVSLINEQTRMNELWAVSFFIYYMKNAIFSFVTWKIEITLQRQTTMAAFGNFCPKSLWNKSQF